MVWSGNTWQSAGGPEAGMFMPGADTCRLSILMHPIPLTSVPQSKDLSVFQDRRVTAKHSSSRDREDIQGLI